MKTCSVCYQDKDESEYHAKSPGRLKAHCKSCQREKWLAWYGDEENRKKHIAHNRPHAIKNKRKLLETIQVLKKRPCTDCGVEYPPYVMDFDHVRGEKVSNVSQIINVGSLAKALAEIEKCEVVCSNCHRIRTHNRLELDTPAEPAGDGTSLTRRQ